MRKLLIALLLLNAVCLPAICQPLAVLAGSGSGGGPVDAYAAWCEKARKPNARV